MQKLNITLSFEEEKLKALEAYLKMGNTSVQKKLEEAMRQLYEQTVPKAVQEYVEAISGSKPKSTPKSKPKAEVKKEAIPDEET